MSTIPLDAIDFEHLADVACSVMTRVNANPRKYCEALPGVPCTKEQFAAMSIAQLFQEYLESLATVQAKR